MGELLTGGVSDKIIGAVYGGDTVSSSGENSVVVGGLKGGAFSSLDKVAIGIS